MSNLPTTFAERVRERITEQIADLIPAEDLTKLIELRITEFKHKELPKLIDDEIRAEFSKSIKAEFQKSEYQPIWNHMGGYGASEAVKKLVTENGGAILASMIGGMVHQTVLSMQQNMPRY